MVSSAESVCLLLTELSLQGELGSRSPIGVAVWLQAPVRRPPRRPDRGVHASACVSIRLRHRPRCVILASLVPAVRAHLSYPRIPDLASHCRLLLHSRPKHTLLWRWLVLYPLYALAEVAIVATDLAELLGSAIALCLLFPRLPLYAGVLLTGADVLILLAVRNPLDGKPVRVFEILIAALVCNVNPHG